MFFHLGKAGKTVQEMKSKYEVEINTTRRSETPFGLDERAISIEGFCSFVTLLTFKKQIKQFCYSRLLYTVSTLALRRVAMLVQADMMILALFIFWKHRSFKRLFPLLSNFLHAQNLFS